LIALKTATEIAIYRSWVVAVDQDQHQLLLQFVLQFESDVAVCQQTLANRRCTYGPSMIQVVDRAANQVVTQKNDLDLNQELTY
jgi:hypothetical protein